MSLKMYSAITFCLIHTDWMDIGISVSYAQRDKIWEF